MSKKVTQKTNAPKSRKQEIYGIFIVCLSLFLLVALVTHNQEDWPNSSRTFGQPYANKGGWLGALCSYGLLNTFGFTSYAGIILLALYGVVVFLHKPLQLLTRPFILIATTGLFVPLLVALTIDIGADNTLAVPAFRYVGITGGLIANVLITYLGRFGAFLVSLAAVLIAIVLGTNLKPSTLLEYTLKAGHGLFMMAVHALRSVYGAYSKKKKTRPKPARKHDETDSATALVEEIIKNEAYKEENPFITSNREKSVESFPHVIDTRSEYRVKTDRAVTPAEHTFTDVDENEPDYDENAVIPEENGEEHEDTIGVEGTAFKKKPPKEYTLPSSMLLDEPQPVVMPESHEEMYMKAQKIVESLRHFNIESEVMQITPGPIVTRYELKLAPGVKVNKVVNLSDDLTMALKAKGGIRILAPIFGKAAIGIEVPNKSRETVCFRDIVESEAFSSTDTPLVLALGKNTAGEPIVADLAKMPHLLIAGSTGSGKSVCINTIIASILMKARPDKVRMIMVDPKVVELTIYNSIPHLLTPVVIDPDRAADALKWAVREMESRYRLLASLGVRDITQFNKKVQTMAGNGNKKDTEIPEPLPFIVVIIDEFADLMVISSNEIEESIARLAQMARAVGIHLVLATQRPSADVITGLIKANFPSRIAFKVMQASNSRIILDQSGADKLLGMGDMLFLQVAKPEPIRLHGAFISNEESMRLVEHVSSQFVQGVESITDEMFRDENQDEEDNVLGLRDPDARDSLFFKAARLVVRTNQGSVSLLQRRLKIGYARAARLIDQLELAGIVSPYDGSKAREVLVDDLYIDDLEAGDL